jgi:hypothetical protein
MIKKKILYLNFAIVVRNVKTTLNIHTIQKQYLQVYGCKKTVCILLKTLYEGRTATARVYSEMIDMK